MMTFFPLESISFLKKDARHVSDLFLVPCGSYKTCSAGWLASLFTYQTPRGGGRGRGGHSSRNMVLLKYRKDQERGHKNTHVYTCLGSQGKSESEVREANCLKKIYIEFGWHTF